MKIVVLGASGMLGSMVVDWLARDPELQVSATTRSPSGRPHFEEVYPSVAWQQFDVEGVSASNLAELFKDADWAINCIGVIKPYIHDDIPAEIERAIHVNTLFPHMLARSAERCGVQILQIATDCVYSGAKGGYLESDAQDAWDVYGKTKSLGEAASPKLHHLRASILGPEPLRHVSLLDWFLKQPRHASITGYTNHRWNGVTTLHFAKLCHGIIRESVVRQGLQLQARQHIVPASVMTKAELMRCFSENFAREDVGIVPAAAPVAVDRTLATVDPAANRRLWQAAGYPQPPSVDEMIRELAEYDYRGAPETSYLLAAGA